MINDYHQLMSLSYDDPEDVNDRQSECYMIFDELFTSSECDKILEQCSSLPEAEGLVGRPVEGFVTDIMIYVSVVLPIYPNYQTSNGFYIDVSKL